MQEIKAGILGFLRNRDSRNGLFTEGDIVRAYFHKVEQNQTTDYIFSTRVYGGGSFSPDLRMEYSGFLYYPSNTIVDPGYNIRSNVGSDRGLQEAGFRVVSMSDAKKEHELLFRKRIEELAEHGGLFDRAKREQTNRGYSPGGDKYGGNDAAVKAFMEGKTHVPFRFSLYIEKWMNFDILEHLDNPVKHASDNAEKYFSENLNDVIDNICHNLKVNDDLVALMNGNPLANESRQMAETIDEQKTVTLDIVKDGKHLTVKYAADRLKWALQRMDRSLGTWDMDAPGRRLFEKEYGRSAYLFPAEIMAIRYGKKTLWSRA